VCQNPRFQPLPAVLKTCRLASLKLGSNTVPKSTVSGTQRLIRNDWKTLSVPMAPDFHPDGVVVKPLSDASLCFNTCVILRADNTSRLIEEYVRMFLRRYSSQRLPSKQVKLSMSA
jgi:hypothetical protein